MEWIFTAKVSLEDIKKRLDEKKWLIFDTTRNKGRIKKDDRILVYHAGEGRQKFIASFTLDSEIIRKGEFDYYVELKDEKIWRKFVPIKPMIQSLSFVKNKNFWGTALQNGVIEISKEDYNSIFARKDQS